jgi:hypothetical protein
MILIAALIIWLVLLAFGVILCRIAASADGRDFALTESYPSHFAKGPRTLTAGLVVWEEQPAVVRQKLRARARGDRGHAGRYAAGS